LGTPEPPVAAGPRLHVVGLYPGDGEGEACEVNSEDGCGVPINATLQLRFDRYLDPATVSRQAIRVYSGAPDSLTPITFDVSYDPVERVVSYRMPAGVSFAPEALYQLEVPLAVAADDQGFRAFDGALLEEGDIPLTTSFLTGKRAAELPTLPVPTCEQVVTEVFSGLGGCTNDECHSSEPKQGFDNAPLGLWLDRRVHVRATAVSRVAHQTEVGNRSGAPLQDSQRFGVQMPIIDPRNPGNSYLLYKLLRGAQNFEPCGENQAVSVCAEPGDPCVSSYSSLPLREGECLPPSAEESERLREWFVLGEPMPVSRRADGTEVLRSVRLQGLRAISRFVAGGADCDQ